MESLPNWLPDNRRFLFTYHDAVFLADVETKQTRELYARTTEPLHSVAASRDGRLLYFTVASTENDIWMLDLN